MPVAPRSRRLAAALALVGLVAAACGGPGPGGSPSATAAPSPSPASAALTVGLGFIPSVQFAQFYLADQTGAYERAGLDVTLQNKIDPELVTLLGQGAVDIGSADGTSVIPAVSNDIPVVYTSTIYADFPSVVIATADAGITEAADLAGKRIGIPGRFGSSWIMLQALLGSAGLTPDNVTIVEFPDFTQAAALQQGAVDAATGFANNEPIQLRNAGIETVVLTVDDVVALPGPGLVAGKATLAAKRDALAAFTSATLDAMTLIAADPQAGLDATFAAVPDLAADPALQRQILDATIAAWKNDRTGAPYGAIDRDGWQASLELMTELGLVPHPITVDQLVDESLLP